LRNTAAYLLALGLFGEAGTAAREGLELAVRTDNAHWAAIAIGHLAHFAAETGDTIAATRLLGYTDAVYRKAGNAREPTELRGYARALDLIRAALPEARISDLLAEGGALDQDAATAEAMAIVQPNSQEGPQ
jgi:hypothetical protein